MAKLYPPHIEGSLPAFCGSTMKIPFEHSRAVAPDYEVKGFYYILKDIQQSKIIASSPVSKDNIDINPDGSMQLLCPVNMALVSVGTFYKCQLAYIGLDEKIGYYSDVGIIKYIQEPEVKFTGLSQVGPNTHQYHYQLWYNCKDPTEKLYSTQFVIAKDTQTNPYLVSEEIIHNTTKDSYYEGFEDYDFLQELSTTENYWIYAMITTTSGYQMLTPFYPLSAQISIPNLNDWRVRATLDYDNGCTSIYCYSQNGVGMSGKFKLARADEREGYAIWHNLIEIEMTGAVLTELSPMLLWRDFTIEQGKNYIYGLFQVTADGKISTRIKSDSIYADFEDSFLFDGDKQLKIRFNPRVSSFKSTVQEAKTDTIGGRYPIVQRNGTIYYKEFPISGLISHLSDEQGYFDKNIANLKIYDEKNVVTDLDAHDGRNYSTNLNSKNIQLERDFKLEVLDWLTNGKPKLFRSPVEGNYLVRLLNTSLSPTDTLGRMLHTFSCTAYEIDNASIEKLVEHNIIKDYYLEGRNEYNFDRNFLSYYLSNLQSDTNLLDNIELQDKQVTGVVFSVTKTMQPTYVNINEVDIEVSDKNNAIQNKNIDSLMQPKSHTFHYSVSDLLTLSYRNVLSSEVYNGIIDDVLSENNVNQYYGMNLLTSFGTNIKNFLQKIYKIICNIRQILQPLKQLTSEVLNLLGISGNAINWGRDILEKIIKYLFGTSPIDSVIYCIPNPFGGVFGYIDGSTCNWIKDGNSIITTAKACIEFFYGATSKIFNIDKETVFTKIEDTVTNIIANPFTCIDIIYKTAKNTFEGFTSSFINNTSTCGIENLIGGLANNFTPITLDTNLVSQGEQILSAIVSNLSSSGQICIPNSLTDSNNQDIINDLLSTTINSTDELMAQASTLASKSVSVLNSILSNTSTGGVTSLLTSVSSSILKPLTGSMGNLFGGMC